MQFDDFYRTVGVFGRYQKCKYFLVCLTYMLPPIVVYTWTFTAAVPNFRCQKQNENISGIDYFNDDLYIPSDDQCRQYQSHLSLHECQRCYTRVDENHSDKSAIPLKACTSFVFNRTYFEKTLTEEWSMVCDKLPLKSFVQMGFFSGYMIGSLVFGFLSDIFGRRPIMGISFLLIILASFICAYAPQPTIGFEKSYAIFLFGRFILACATRGVALTGFVIGVEIVGPEQRLFTGIVIEYFFAIGQLVLLVFAYTIRTWRLLQIALAMLSIPFVFFYFLLPESPRWLISKGYYDEAERILRNIANANKTNFDSTAYQRLISDERNKEAAASKRGHGLMHLLRSKIMCIISLNVSFQWFAQNLAFYGVSQNTGAWSDNPYTSFAAGALIEIVAYFVTHGVLRRYGRKTSYCSFVIGFSCFAFLLASIQKLTTTRQHHLTFLVNIILKFFVSGSYAIIYIYANELFPTHARNTGIGICSMVARFGAIAGTVLNDLLSRISVHLPAVVFGVISAMAVAFITIIPETSHRQLPQTIEDVEQMGLVLPCRQPKAKQCQQVNNEDNVDENIMLNNQTQSNV